MQKRTKYLTHNKLLIMDNIKKLDSSFNAQQLYQIMLDGQYKIGLTTIYRILAELYQNGILKKSYGENNIVYYQYIEHCEKNNHFYLQCDVCCRLIHIDCDCITLLQEHIFNHHNFITNNKNIIIRGICEHCKGENIK